MSNLRIVLAVLGVAVSVAGLAMVVDPALAGLVPSGSEIVQLIGILAIVQGGRILWHRYRTEFETGTVDEPPEVPPVGPEPGAGFDALAAAAATATSGRALRSRRNRLRRRLRRAAVSALWYRERLDSQQAHSALDAGTWTDDPHAAALFTDEVVVHGSSQWLSLSRGGPGSLTHRANRAALAVGELAGVETGADEPETSQEDASTERQYIGPDVTPGTSEESVDDETPESEESVDDETPDTISGVEGQR